MATTENFINGDGLQDTFSFSFPYLKTEDVRVELQEIDSTKPTNDQIISTLPVTAFTIPGSNPTQIQFNSVTSNNYQLADGTPRATHLVNQLNTIRVRIYRVTSSTQTPTTIFAGSAIRAQDLNTNFDQSLYIQQENQNTINAAIQGTIADGAITTSKIADNAVTTSKILDSNVTTGKLANLSVNAAKIATDAVTTIKIEDSAVNSDKLATDAVIEAKILNNAVTTSKILDLNVTTGKLADDAVTTGKLASNAVTSGELASNAVTTSKIVDGNVTSGKIASNAVTTSKIADDAVTVSHLEFTGSNDRFYLAGNNTDEIVLWLGRRVNGDYVTGDHGLRCYSGASDNYTQLMGRNSGTDSYFLRCRRNDIDRYRIAADGDVTNTNNSYGAISDQKLKENIVDAASQWDDVKAIKVRTFNFKEETRLSTETQIGWVAQEVELVSPGCVKTSADIDNDDQPLETSTKIVKTTVLLIKAYKALQEAMERIETLEAKVTALTSD